LAFRRPQRRNLPIELRPTSKGGLQDRQASRIRWGACLVCQSALAIAPLLACLWVPYFMSQRFRDNAMPMLGRAWTAVCMLSLAILSWTPGQFMVRTGSLSGHEEHFLAYFISAATIILVRRASNTALTGLALVLYAGALEWGQLYVPGRHPAIADFCASASGALSGVLLTLAGMHATRRSRKQQRQLSRPQI
jgi:VanZ family protein